MGNKFLLPIYQKVYNEKFSYSNFDDRLKMQKMVYLLQELGVNIGHYGFDWYKHGPYSQMLLDDMYAEKGTELVPVNYLADTEKRIDDLKVVFLDKDAISTYGIKNWTECLASIHFLKKKVMKSNATSQEVLEELKNRKQHLDDDTLNERAYHFISELFY